MLRGLRVLRPVLARLLPPLGPVRLRVLRILRAFVISGKTWY
jgi:hypothetical protein